MNTKSEGGQAILVFVGILALVGIAVLMLMMAGNQRGMQAGAQTIGNAVGNAIDDAAYQQYQQEMQNLDWQVSNGTVVSAWVNNQRIYPNEHSLLRHDAAAMQAINCYNDHGTFLVMKNKRNDWYFNCLEEDGKTVRWTIWKQVGKKFFMKTAYTKGDGSWTWNQIRTFLEREWGATKATFPSDGILYIDDFPAPFIK